VKLNWNKDRIQIDSILNELEYTKEKLHKLQEYQEKHKKDRDKALESIKIVHEKYNDKLQHY